MSNKIVPNIYRAVIDDVILHIKDEFDEYGVAEDVLAELQNKWENKVIASRVAEFEMPQQAVPPPVASSQHHHGYAPHMQHAQYLPHNPYAAIAASANQSAVKSEPVDNRFMLTPSMQYSLPPLPGPSINGSRQVAAPPHPGGQTGVLSFPRAAPAPTARYTPTTQQPAQSQPLPAQTASQRMPQTDGPSQSSEDEDSPSPPGSQPAFAPRASHPSLPQPSLPPSSTQSSQQEDLEAINSDLDDSDTEGEDDAEEGAAGETDIVFCTYDKVARVKNKWKCILKDGMIHVNGKDYLFAKCTGEFEW